jgi:hypothetical protein
MLMCPALLPTFYDNEHSSLVGLPRPTKHFVLAQICFSIVATYRKESIVSRLMSASIPNLGDDILSNPCIPLAAPSKVTTELQLLTMSKNFAPLLSFDMPFPTQSPNSIVWVMFFGWYSLGESASKERCRLLVGLCAFLPFRHNEEKKNIWNSITLIVRHLTF